MTPTSARRPSRAQLNALAIAADGRAQYGSEYPAMDRRASARGRHQNLKTFLVDGNGIYGAEHATWPTLEDRGWITVRHDLLRPRLARSQTHSRHHVHREIEMNETRVPELVDLRERFQGGGVELGRAATPSRHLRREDRAAGSVPPPLGAAGGDDSRTAATGITGELTH